MNKRIVQSFYVINKDYFDPNDRFDLSYEKNGEYVKKYFLTREELVMEKRKLKTQGINTFFVKYLSPRECDRINEKKNRIQA